MLPFLLAAALLQASASRFLLASAIDREGRPAVGLEADDFLVREENQLRTTLDAWPAVYPVAILVDNTQNARADFIQIRSAVHQFVGSLSGREVALYSFGDRATRIVDFTTDLKKVEKATENLFALPESESHVLDAVIEAARDIRKREVPVAAIVVVSAGGNDQSNRTPREVFEPVLGSRSIVHVMDMRSPRASGRLGRVRGLRNGTSDRAAEAALGLEEVLRGLAERTQGGYDHVYAASGFGALLQELRMQLVSEVFVEYEAPSPGVSPGLAIGVRLPGVTVRGVGLDREPRR
ncbi:MAG: VWA domain-containing protein [Vicinamibacterales bacterium]